MLLVDGRHQRSCDKPNASADKNQLRVDLVYDVTANKCTMSLCGKQACKSHFHSITIVGVNTWLLARRTVVQMIWSWSAQFQFVGSLVKAATCFKSSDIYLIHTDLAIQHVHHCGNTRLIPFSTKRSSHPSSDIKHPGIIFGSPIPPPVCYFTPCAPFLPESR